MELIPLPSPNVGSLSQLKHKLDGRPKQELARPRRDDSPDIGHVLGLDNTRADRLNGERVRPNKHRDTKSVTTAKIYRSLLFSHPVYVTDSALVNHYHCEQMVMQEDRLISLLNTGAIVPLLRTGVTNFEALHERQVQQNIKYRSENVDYFKRLDVYCATARVYNGAEIASDYDTLVSHWIPAKAKASKSAYNGKLWKSFLQITAHARQHKEYQIFLGDALDIVRTGRCSCPDSQSWGDPEDSVATQQRLFSDFRLPYLANIPLHYGIGWLPEEWPKARTFISDGRLMSASWARQFRVAAPLVYARTFVAPVAIDTLLSAKALSSLTDSDIIMWRKGDVFQGYMLASEIHEAKQEDVGTSENDELEYCEKTIAYYDELLRWLADTVRVKSQDPGQRRYHWRIGTRRLGLDGAATLIEIATGVATAGPMGGLTTIGWQLAHEAIHMGGSRDRVARAKSLGGFVTSELSSRGLERPVEPLAGPLV